ncbi:MULTISPECIES: ABC transporter permease [Methanobacterium]|jgi:putative ABC transport system permease protein|uniref:ABC transporter permease n=1 Tax=Methanobacterium veterum TaxID=408577 RepID=A0A9E5DL47_9EURY|nr:MULTISPECIES: ABC transporter permease [Methanobacterium]MCZ3365477.1 ABC transporter permease [Methanobacterium veterum]MCZ3373229.1 ABC transporter permease [Methanobacterium veterum]
MKFRNLIIKNIFRNKSRSLLAVFGIAIGVAAVVGLGLVTDNLSTSTQKALTAGAADFSVIYGTNSGSEGPGGGGGPSGSMGGQQLINESKVSEIQQISGVGNATGVLRTNIDLSDNSTSNSTSSNSTSESAGPQGNFRMNMYSVIGIDSSDLSMDDIVITNGNTYSNGNEVIIGKTAAQRLNKSVGDTLNISNQTFKIVGTYETGNFMDDQGVVMSLSKLQNLTGDTGEVSLILVKAADGTSATDLADTIEQKYPNELSTSTSLSGMDRMNNGLDVINSGSWAVSLLAVIVGGIVVVVTMMKAVSERTREIGVLRAIGWTKHRIMTMILGESLVLSVIAILVGLVVGIGVVEIISATNLMRGIEPAFSAYLLLKGIGVALFLGLVGGIYPAYRASRLAPTEALRYE